MRVHEQLGIVKGTTDKIVQTLISKGHDYASDDDILRNFKEVGEIVGILKIDTATGTGQALEMVVRKLHRVCNLISQKKSPENESLSDNFTDLLGYGLLALCNAIEELS